MEGPSMEISTELDFTAWSMCTSPHGCEPSECLGYNPHIRYLTSPHVASRRLTSPKYIKYRCPVPDSNHAEF